MSVTTLKSVTCSFCLLNTFISSLPQGFSSLRKINTSMRAIQIHSFGGPSVLKVESNVTLPTPSSEQVLVRVHAAGINPIDAYMREQTFSHVPKLPLILGKEVAGDVVQVGDGFADIQHDYKTVPCLLSRDSGIAYIATVLRCGLTISENRILKLGERRLNSGVPPGGDRVICCLPDDGGYAEYVVCNLTNILRLPDHLTYAQGAAVYVAYFTAYRSLVTKLNLKANELVLVHGASGSVGMAAVQIAKSIGAVVVGTAGTEEGRRMVADIGADYVVNHRDKTHVSEAIALVPGCKGFDAILENRATANLAMDMAALGPNGRICVVGAKESATIDPRFLIKTEGYVTGVKMSGISQSQWNLYVKAITRGMSEGWVKPVIAREYDMDEIQLAHQHLMKKHGHHGKLVLRVS